MRNDSDFVNRISLWWWQKFLGTDTRRAEHDDTSGI